MAMIWYILINVIHRDAVRYMFLPFITKAFWEEYSTNKKRYFKGKWIRIQYRGNQTTKILVIRRYFNFINLAYRCYMPSSEEPITCRYMVIMLSSGNWYSYCLLKSHCLDKFVLIAAMMLNYSQWHFHGISWHCMWYLWQITFPGLEYIVSVTPCCYKTVFTFLIRQFKHIIEFGIISINIIKKGNAGSCNCIFVMMKCYISTSCMDSINVVNRFVFAVERLLHDGRFRSFTV